MMKSKIKLAELSSIFGASVIGFGLGLLFANYVQQYAVLIILVGIMMHGLGMYKTHSKKEERWINLLYWICWLILIGLAILVFTRLF